MTYIFLLITFVHLQSAIAALDVPADSEPALTSISDGIAKLTLDPIDITADASSSSSSSSASRKPALDLSPRYWKAGPLNPPHRNAGFPLQTIVSENETVTMTPPCPSFAKLIEDRIKQPEMLAHFNDYIEKRTRQSTEWLQHLPRDDERKEVYQGQGNQKLFKPSWRKSEPGELPIYDTRQEIASTLEPLYMPHVLIYHTESGEYTRRHGTGYIIADNIILTAAHCLFQQENREKLKDGTLIIHNVAKWYKLLVAPSYHKGQKPLGEFKIEQMIIPTAYAEGSPERSADFGLIILDRSNLEKSLDLLTDFLGTKVIDFTDSANAKHPLKGHHLHIGGYAGILGPYEESKTNGQFLDRRGEEILLPIYVAPSDDQLLNIKTKEDLDSLD